MMGGLYHEAQVIAGRGEAAVVTSQSGHFKMGFIPHPPIYLSLIRINDIWLLLAIGASYELLCRLYLLNLKIKPSVLVRLEQQLETLQIETNAKRKLGQSAFVETSKLERQCLALEKKVEEINDMLQHQVQNAEKVLLRGGNMQLAVLVWLLYYSVPIMTVEEVETTGEIGAYISAGTFLKTMFFPIASVGLGVRVSRFGLPAELATSSIGGLMVMWSAQATIGKLMDAVDAYYVT